MLSNFTLMHKFQDKELYISFILQIPKQEKGIPKGV